MKTLSCSLSVIILYMTMTGCSIVSSYFEPEDVKQALANATNGQLSGVFTVNFDSRGGSSVDSQTVLPGGYVVEPANPTKISNDFRGWYREISCTTPWIFTNDTVTADMTLYAKWLNSYTVIFDSQGATVPADPSNIIVNVPDTNVASLPTPPTKINCVFDGWWTETNGGGIEFTASSVVTQNVTVYAKWLNYYTVTFDSMGATAPASPSSTNVVLPATTIDALPAPPTRTGCDFAGWITATNGSGIVFTESTTVTSNMTVYAMWSTSGMTFTLINGNTEYSVGAGSATNAVTVLIPEYWSSKKVTSLSNNAFQYCRNLTNITIPNGVTNIGNNAFLGCTNLGSLTLPGAVQTIGSGAFYACYPLKNLIIPNGVKIIGTDTFNSCVGLTNLTLSGTLASIGTSAFSKCKNLPGMTIPNSVTNIGNNAFQDCSNLTSLILPSSLLSIGNYAFWKCVLLTNMTIPNSVISMGTGSFADCQSLMDMTITGGVTRISDYTFDNCYALTNLVLPNGLTSIGTYVFSDCGNLKGLTIPSGVTNIGSCAFYNCSNVTGLSLPGTLITLGSFAFFNCTGLTNLTVPATLANIPNSAFQSCTGLTNVTISSGVANIGNNSFQSCTGLTTMTIPSTVTNLGAYSFNNCSGLNSLNMEPLAAPTADATYTFGIVTGCTLHIHTGTTGYNVVPWTDTGIFSTILTDLP